MYKFLLLLLLSAPCFAQLQSLVVATDIWPKYTSEQSDALYEDILREVFAGYEIEFVYTDYTRSKAKVKNGKADLWLGAYENEEPFIVTPKEAMDADFVHAMYLTDLYPDSPPDFNSASAVWFTDYLYDRYFPEFELTGYEVNDIATAMRLLEAQKVAFMLGDNSELKEAMREANIDDIFVGKVRFGTLEVYPAFAKTEKMAPLARIWDNRLKTMKEDGSLAALFEKHQLLSEYPFQRH